MFPPAGPKQKTGMMQGRLTSHMNHSPWGRENEGRSPFSGTQEAREKWGPASYLPTTQEQLLPKVGMKAPLEPNMNLRLSLSLAWVRVCSCDTWLVTH